MFGRQPRLPVDLAFGLPVSKTCHNHSEYVKHLKDNLEKSYHLASKNAEKIMQKIKTRFDRTVTASELNVAIVYLFVMSGSGENTRLLTSGNQPSMWWLRRRKIYLSTH